MSRHSHECGGHGNLPYPSVAQTIDEMEFERGIWNAAMDGDVKRVENFIRKGVHVDSEDTSGYTALHYASRHGQINVCKLLLQNGATVDAQTRSGGVTSLQRAAYCGHIDIVKLLISNNANILLQDNDGKTALHKAVERGRVEVALVLIDKSPQVKLLRDKRGNLADYYTPDNCERLKDICRS